MHRGQRTIHGQLVGNVHTSTEESGYEAHKTRSASKFDDRPSIEIVGPFSDKILR